MSAYSDAILGTSGLVAYFRAAEPSGTAMVDDSGVIGNATYAGSGVTLGQTSLLPADSGTCVLFDGTNGRASHANHASLNITSQITVIAWVQPTLIRTQHVLYRFGSYGLSQRGAYFSWELSGVGSVGSPPSSVVSYNSYMIAGTYTGTAQNLYMNGVQVGTAARSNQSIASTSNILEIGSVIAVEKWAGYLSHIALFNTGLSTATIQNLYTLGAQTAAQTAGLAAQVYPFSTQIVAANPNRKKLTIWNDSGTTIWLRLGTGATVNTGPRLIGNGDRWSTTTYTGAVHAIHAGYIGGKNVTISEEV
jgi:hypothetical protein